MWWVRSWLKKLIDFSDNNSGFKASHRFILNRHVLIHYFFCSNNTFTGPSVRQDWGGARATGVGPRPCSSFGRWSEDWSLLCRPKQRSSLLKINEEIHGCLNIGRYFSLGGLTGIWMNLQHIPSYLWSLRDHNGISEANIFRKKKWTLFQDMQLCGFSTSLMKLFVT